MMLKLNQKIQSSISEHLSAISGGSFDENTVKLLLVDLREMVAHTSHLKEICHFIAHPERDKGLFHNKILSRYERINYIQDIFEKLDFKAAKPGMQFEDLFFQQAGYEFYERIAKRYFEIVFIDGLDDFEDSFYNLVFNCSKDEIAKIISQSYKKKDGHYLLRSKDLSKVKKIMSILHTSIQFRPILTEKEFIGELVQAILLVSPQLDIEMEYADKLALHADDIFACVLCLLHDVNFIHHSDVIGSSFLSISKNKLTLCCNFAPKGKLHTFVLLSSDVPVSRYMIDPQVELKDYEPLPFFTLRRSSRGELFLK
jgi:hypothetical protein